MSLGLKELLRLLFEKNIYLIKRYLNTFFLCVIGILIVGCTGQKRLIKSEIIQDQELVVFEDLEHGIRFEYNKLSYPVILSKLDNLSEVIIVQRGDFESNKTFTLLKPVNEITSPESLWDSSLSASLQFTDKVIEDIKTKKISSISGLNGVCIEVSMKYTQTTVVTYLFYKNQQTYTISFNNPIQNDHELIAQTFDVQL